MSKGFGLNKISDAIDELLDRPKWSKREHIFYQMLVSKVKQYRQIPKTCVQTTTLASDKQDIIRNLNERKWFKLSHNQGTIIDLINSMKIIECIHQGNPESRNYHYRLDLVFNRQKSFHIIMDIAKDPRTTSKPPYFFRLYYESDGTKGHIAAFTPGKKSGHTLPENIHLDRILPILKRHESVSMAIELLLYYDIDGIMSKMPMGNGYPVTLDTLITNISKSAN